MTANRQIRTDEASSEDQPRAARDRVAIGRPRSRRRAGRRAGGNGGAMAEALRRAALVDQVRADRPD